MSASEEFGVYLYGSEARGEASHASDVDVLVVSDGMGEPISSILTRELEQALPLERDVDVSFYSIARLREMYAEGHLFAWHLHCESKFLGYGTDVVQRLGPPCGYHRFSEDALPLLELLVSISGQLHAYPSNAVYEAGIAYVCLRNIGMSASYFSPGGLTFSPWAPYLLGYEDNLLGIESSSYGILRKARLSGTRGTDPPSMDALELTSLLEPTVEWARREIDRVRRGGIQ